MRIPLVPDPPVPAEAIEAAVAQLRSGRLSQGEKVAEFEAAFAAMHGYPADRAVFCNSGSSANLLAVTALDLQPGDEVIVPAVTWPTQVWPIVQCGGVPVLCDADPETMNLRNEAARQAIEESPSFAAVFEVHTLGNARDVEGRRRRGVAMRLLEDCCEALGAARDGRKVGTLGRFGTFSFYLSHHLTTIEGGMVLCRDAADADRLRAIRSHGWTRHLSPKGRILSQFASDTIYRDIDPRFLFVEPGYNLRGTDVAAAMGLAQMPLLDGWAARRRAIAAHWTASLDRGLFRPVKWAPGAVPFAFPLVLAEKSILTTENIGSAVTYRELMRPKLIRHLEAAGIETRPLLAGNLARQPVMRKVRHRIAGPLTGADYLHTNALYVGLHPGLTDAQVEYLPAVLKGFK